MAIKHLTDDRYYGSWSYSNDENCEYPTIAVYGNTEKEAATKLIKELERVILEAQDAIEELQSE